MSEGIVTPAVEVVSTALIAVAPELPTLVSGTTRSQTSLFSMKASPSPATSLGTAAPASRRAWAVAPAATSAATKKMAAARNTAEPRSPPEFDEAFCGMTPPPEN